jgi:hypothetical protein
MMMRLAFSVAVNVDPDILILDEVIAVGDQAFQAKCRDKIYEFRRAGKTMLSVAQRSHLVRFVRTGHLAGARDCGYGRRAGRGSGTVQQLASTLLAISRHALQSKNGKRNLTR